jgi:hypothetical protein
VLMKVETPLNFWVGKHDFCCLYSALMESMIFIVLSSLETVHDTVQYKYCIFSLLCHLLRIRLKRQNLLLSYVRERERSTPQMYNAVYSTLYYYSI